MMQSFAMMAIITVLWAMLGYSLAFDSGTALHRRPSPPVPARRRPRARPDYAATIPLQTFMIYQLMFAIITPALIAGAFAERMKFSAMALFLTLWSLLVYAPMAHMVWGKGGLLNAALGGASPPRLRRRHRRPHHLRSLRAGLRPLSRQARRLSQRSMPPHICRAQLHRRLPALGRLVWL